MNTLFLRIIIAGLLSSLLIICPDGHRIDAASAIETIRVAIVKNASSVKIDGDRLLALNDKGGALDVLAPVTVKPVKNGLLIEGDSRVYSRLTFSAASAVYVNGKPYRGSAELNPGEKGILVINELQMEDYLTGLINCEISSAWPIEAVKAQAVIARTYALNRKNARKNSPYHLESSVMDQVYEGCEIEDSRARRGVMDTAGEILTHNGAIIQAFYHSNCGGRTEAAENVWGASIPYLKGVECQYCQAAQSSAWEQKLTLREIEDKLRSGGVKTGTVIEIRPGNRNSRGRLRNVLILHSRGETSLTGDQFRKAVGYGIIKSTNFSIRAHNGEVFFSGIGNGHGVGLCQWGSKQRSLEGFAYTEILSYYYPGTNLGKISDNR